MSLSSSVSFSFSLLKLALLLFLLRLVIASSFCLFFLLFILGFTLVILRLLLSIRISDISRYSILLLSISSSQLGFLFRLPVRLYTALLLLLLSITSISTPSVTSVSTLSVLSIVFTVLLVICYNRGRKPNQLRLLLPISNSPGNIYTRFLGQYRFAQSLAFASSIRAVSFL